MWIRFATPGEQSVEAAGYVDFARRRSALRYEIPGEAAGNEPVEREQVLDATGTYIRAAAPGAVWQAVPSVGGGAGPGDPLGFLDVLQMARPGVRALELEPVSGVPARRYRMVADGERIWAQGAPDVTMPLRERLGLAELEDPVVDVWIDGQSRVRRIEGLQDAPLSPGTEIVTTVEFGDFGIEVGEIPLPAVDERIDLDDLLPEHDESSG